MRIYIYLLLPTAKLPPKFLILTTGTYPTGETQACAEPLNKSRIRGWICTTQFQTVE